MGRDEIITITQMDRAKKGFLSCIKDSIFKESNRTKLERTEMLLSMMEQGRISRDEYILLVSTPENLAITLTIDNSINANGGTWGGRVIMGDNNGRDY